MRAQQHKSELLSLFARLELAMATHDALDEEPSPARPHPDASSNTKSPPASPTLLQTELDDHHDTIDFANRANETSSVVALADQLQRALAKIGSDEKDELLVHLLQQATSHRAQLSEVATLGETIAGQLVRQQHELRTKHREQFERLEQELHDAVHAHPRVAVLEAKVDELEEQSREKDERLRFAVLKLQRSRQREKKLKMLHDPLWDI
ncbi:hypothetical protein PybrP1_011395 [[Pythium] brassicae (nom. inval.)]|nr:hypothetical protein PybrP1_011395 [[Pythium] brassicae (nom. inval.)]